MKKLSGFLQGLEFHHHMQFSGVLRSPVAEGVTPLQTYNHRIQQAKPTGRIIHTNKNRLKKTWFLL